MIKEKNKPDIQRRKLITYSVLIPFMLLGCIVSCFYLTVGNSNTICFNTPFPSYANLEQTALFSFPTSASNIQFTTNALNRKGGCTIWLQFEMDASDFDEFKASTLVEDFANIRLEDDAFEYLSERMAWIQPLDSIAGQGYSNEGSRAVYTEQWIFIDTHDPSRWIVYLITNMEWL